VSALLGGLHLKGAPPGTVEAAAEALARHGVERVYPNHCTGPDGAGRLRALLGERVHPGCAGAGFRLVLP
jgi:metal-dependent hydrolase (beta-lactamase superfamily II)